MRTESGLDIIQSHIVDAVLQFLFISLQRGNRLMQFAVSKDKPGNPADCQQNQYRKAKAKIPGMFHISSNEFKCTNIQ